ncbi:serine hydrolase domain-containing protein [Actinokineospora iranica]|uniref:CubicO group peptidase, beta-lactamase class C family n=1 Tax=Actinokineospora iranica TaxID=1271860 RepID=A0A1G6Z541_9PSEU|nr:serine hydrolase domain-containing protein [Actinokineospora iranica]SDD97748.1 CubicO group peptidase, beta-lactamase class C family [Actinokineospora iranica]
MSGLSKPRLDRWRAALAGHVDRGSVPGLVALLSRHGETHVEAMGGQAVGGAPMARDTIFRISSMSKPVTAVAAMILLEECVLRLDDPVDDLLPELADPRVLRSLDSPTEDTVPAEQPITVRHIMASTFGQGLIMAPPGTYPIQDEIARVSLAPGPPTPASPPDPDEWIRRIGRLPLLTQPGRTWWYDTSYDVLGVLVARASGQPLDAFLRERIFAPLGMVDTGFHVPETKTHRFATAYTRTPESDDLAVYDPAENGQWNAPPAFPSGGGGLVSTADDYLAFGRMLLDNGRYPGGRILSRLSVRTMTTDQLTPGQKSNRGVVDFDTFGWGFGLAVVTRRDAVDKTPGAFGWDGGLGTTARMDPAEDLTGILLTQQAWTSPAGPPVRADFLTSAYQAIDD